MESSRKEVLQALLELHQAKSVLQVTKCKAVFIRGSVNTKKVWQLFLMLLGNNSRKQLTQNLTCHNLCCGHLFKSR